MILLEIESALRKIAKACVAEGIKQEVVCMVLRNMMISEHNRLLYQAPGLTKKEGRPN
jgi:hypothetical protein